MSISTIIPASHRSSCDSPFASLTRVCFSVVCDHLDMASMLACATVNRHWRREMVSYCSARVRSFTLWQSTIGDLRIRSNLSFRPLPLPLLTHEDGSPIYPKVQDPTTKFVCKKSSCPFSLVQLIGSFCPNLSTLVFRYEHLDANTLDALLHLLTIYRTSLVSFTFFTRKVVLSNSQSNLMAWPDERVSVLLRLFAHINQLTKLETLSLEFYEERLDFMPDLAALGWVRTFKFYSADEWDILYPSLLQYASTNVQLVNIEYMIEGKNYSIPNYWRLIAALEQYSTTEAGRRVASKFRFFYDTVLQFVFPLNTEQLDSLCNHFTSLALLRLYKIPLTDWHELMARLSRLVNLIEFDFVGEYETLNESEVWSEEEISAFKTKQPSLAQLSSVRVIWLSLNVASHQHLRQFCLDHYFPRLQMFALSWTTRDDKSIKASCCACRSCWPMEAAAGQHETEHPISECIRAVLADWKTSDTPKYVSLSCKQYFHFSEIFQSYDETFYFK